MYGAVPPVTVAVTEPSHMPLQLMLVEMIETVGAPELPTVVLPVAVHPLESVTVTL